MMGDQREQWATKNYSGTAQASPAGKGKPEESPVKQAVLVQGPLVLCQAIEGTLGTRYCPRSRRLSHCVPNRHRAQHPRLTHSRIIDFSGGLARVATLLSGVAMSPLPMLLLSTPYFKYIDVIPFASCPE